MIFVDGEYHKKAIKRFEDKYTKTMLGCWDWTAGTFHFGHGKFRYNNKFVKAHRFSFQLYTGESVEGKMCLHKCNRPGCINPTHLYLGTQKDNMQDILKANRNFKRKRETCDKGHPFKGENLLMDNGARRCKICTYARSKIYRDRRRNEKRA